MTIEQYRCLCAHMSFWRWSLEKTMADCGITDYRQAVIDELWKCGWNHNEETETLEYEE